MIFKQKNILSIIILVAFITVAVFGILSITPSHTHEPGCPFMPGEQAICPMGLLEHISAWKNIFTVSVPYAVLLILVIFLILSLWFLIHPPNYFFFKYKRLRQVGFAHITLYQELFSQGILNPKAP